MFIFFIVFLFLTLLLLHIGRYAFLYSSNIYCEYLFDKIHQSFCVIKSTSFNMISTFYDLLFIIKNILLLCVCYFKCSRFVLIILKFEQN